MRIAWVQGARVPLVPLLILAGFALTPVVHADRAVEVYRAQHRMAQELLPLAQAALGSEGTAAIDPGTNSIVLVGEAAAVGAAKELLLLQDRARKTVIVTVESHRVGALDAAGYRIAWTADAGSLRVGSILIPGEGSRVHAVGRLLTTSEDRAFTSVVRILDGETGRIATGRAVPVRSPGLVGSTTMVEASSGLRATPRVLGDGRVQVELSPFQGEVDPGGRVEFREAATTVIVKPGEMVVVGGLQRHDSLAGTAVFSSRTRRESREDEILLLRIEVE